MSAGLISRYKREASVALSYVVLLVVVSVIAPSFLQSSNLRDLAMNNASVLLVAIGMTLVIIAGEIDISVGSQFAVCTYVTGLLAKAGTPTVLLIFAVILTGALMGGVGGALIARLRIPSIVVTLALMVIWRDGLRWATEGAWIQDLPSNFQWFGLGQSAGQFVVIATALLVLVAFGWALGNLAAGRSIYAVGSDAEAARLAGIDPQRVKLATFVLMGSLVALAAVLNSVRFSIIPSNAGIGLELKAIAAVVVGGAAITGGRGTIVGTLIGVALLGTIGTALTFVGINPFWEKAIQGLIILAAVVSDAALRRFTRFGFGEFRLRTETQQ
jgi:rhamnose transport system permease protein